MALAPFILKNAGWKLASLLIAIAIWASIHSTVEEGPPSVALPPTESERRAFVLPITVMTTATDSRGFYVRPSSVEVVVRGPAGTIHNLLASDLQVFVDLVDVTEARELRKRILVRTPPGITLHRITPDEVLVERADSP